VCDRSIYQSAALSRKGVLIPHCNFKHHSVADGKWDRRSSFKLEAATETLGRPLWLKFSR
jgi:hypothetical protein